MTGMPPSPIYVPPSEYLQQGLAPQPVCLSPVRRIPPELLGEIFKKCLLNDTFVLVSTGSAPLLLSQVCSAWRNVAFSISTLWSSLRVVISRRASTPQLPLLNFWLERSCSQPLSLSLELDEFPPVPAELVAAALPILHFFSTKSSRWQSLRLVLPGSHMLIHSVLGGSAPKLESLSLDLRSWRQSETAEIDLLLRSAPSLHQFSWSNRPSWGSWDIEFEDVIGTLQVSWGNMTRLVLDSWLTLEDSYDVLRQCHSLVDCEFRHFAGGSLTPSLVASQPSLSLPHLESFKLYQHELNHGLGLLFDMLSCPSLQHIYLTCGHVNGVLWPQSQFAAFFSRSSCLLQTLSLEFTGVNEDGLTQILSMNSASLLCLEVYDARGDICVTDKLLVMLTDGEDSTQPLLCPRLKTIVLHRVMASTDGGFARMLQSRLQPTSHYASLHIPQFSRIENVDLDFSGDNSKNIIDLAYLRSAQSQNFLTVRGI
ncbi:hypothetical protein BD779DRAFT_1467500 [Infundibulicybe gibba]|nr:hypothetical protein BD779DRAFT_1467500 [Infundibulicybe gibba]